MSENLLVEIVSPDGAAFRGEAVSFRAPGVQGGFEILRNHAPMVAATGVGPERSLASRPNEPNSSIKETLLRLTYMPIWILGVFVGGLACARGSDG